MSFEGSIPHAYKVLLESIENEIWVTVFCVDFLRGEVSRKLNGLLKCDDVHAMLEEKD